MIKNWLITGDTHGRVPDRLATIQTNSPEFKPAETAVIILGDAGLNYWLNKSDKRNKQLTSSFGYHVYCVRGNHEDRPANVKTMKFMHDDLVGAPVWYEEEFPLIKYFVDGVIYDIDGYKCLVIGGAYSVDKFYRLERAAASGNSHTGWFKDEQLTHDEMTTIAKGLIGQKVDFVFTHTCPISWEPYDLFIGGIDQSKVDKSMEVWMDSIKDTFQWNIWCFGHYHADRIERPHVEQFYQEYELMSKLWDRWMNNGVAKEWWLPKSPNYYVDYPKPETHDYTIDLNIRLRIKNAEDKEEAMQYLDDFFVGLSDMIYSSDESDDHYELESVNPHYNSLKQID